MQSPDRFLARTSPIQTFPLPPKLTHSPCAAPHAGPQSPSGMYSPIQSPFTAGGAGFSPGPAGMFSPGPQSPGYSPTSPRYASEERGSE
eukprot:1143188-Pelagomonas_calceolata.AAC.7